MGPENIQNLGLELHWGKLKVQKMEIFSEATEEQTIKLPTVHHFIVYSEQLKQKGLNQWESTKNFSNSPVLNSLW